MHLFWILSILLLILLTLYMIISTINETLYFRSKKVYHLPNPLPSAIYKFIIKRQGFINFIHTNYNKMRSNGVSISGHFQLNKIIYTIFDLDLLKHIFIKDFNHFVNHRPFPVPEGDILISKMLMFLIDDEWKQLRSKLSPTFTTGKIKKLFPLFKESGTKMVTHFEERMKQSETREIELSEGFSKFTMDTIATAVCGIESRAFDQTEPSRFERMAKNLQISFSAKSLIGLVVVTLLPKLSAWLGLSLFGRDTHEFFGSAIKSRIQERIETGQKGNDFIQLMMQAREDKLKVDETELNKYEKDALIQGIDKLSTSSLSSLDDDGIVSNCVLFILAGFDTTLSLLLFCAYSLALNPEIQDKLRAEVDSVMEENYGEISYESLHGMTYLDMVINETLRLYPPVPMIDRSCTVDFKLPGTDTIVTKGSQVLVPVIGIHHDERYYPEPELFIPERFSHENKGKIPSYAFLPFGHGPRNCIGMRFALTEAKLAIAELVHNFDIEPSSKTMIPMEYQNVASLKPRNGMWLALERRSTAAF